VQTDADSGSYHISYTLSGTSVTEADVIDPTTNTSRSTFDSSGLVSAIADASGMAVQETITYTRVSKVMKFWGRLSAAVNDELYR
jgi:hypothetical protein